MGPRYCVGNFEVIPERVGESGHLCADYGRFPGGGCFVRLMPGADVTEAQGLEYAKKIIEAGQLGNYEPEGGQGVEL